MAVSEERVKELLVLHQQIEDRCALVDEKYSLTACEPRLDMPPSLNLEKLVFTPKTEEELRALATESVNALMLSKERSAEKTYNSAIKNYEAQKQKLTEQADLDYDKAQLQLEEKKEDIKRKVADNGLYFSDIAERFCRLAENDSSSVTKEIYAKLDLELKALSQKTTDAETLYNETLAALKEERQAREDKAYSDLLQDEEEERVAVEKYNNGVEEKEQKYQASRAKAYENAYRAEQNRTLKNTQLYADLGETGYRDVISREKYAVCIDMCTGLTRREANVLLSFDSFFDNALGNYFSSFLNWITTLRAD